MILESPSPRPYPLLRTPRLALRLFMPHEVGAVIDYYRRNAEYLAPWEPTRPPDFLTEEYWRRFASRCRDEFEGDLALRLFLFPNSSPGRIVGYVGLFNFVRGSGHFCTLGYSLDEQCQGQGYMAETLGEVVRFAFEELSMHKVLANYIPHNVRSARLLERLGFDVDGFSRDFLMINGRWEDHILTSLTNPNWKAL
jgi:ribosomal-protein-alanine N-acetyltransferase